MRGSIATLLVAGLLVAAALGQSRATSETDREKVTTAPTPQAGNIFVPESSKVKPGLQAHTTYVLRSPDGKAPKAMALPSALAVSGPAIATTQVPETPASLGCLYVNSPKGSACTPSNTAGSGGPSAAGYGAIVLVDAFDNPNADTDLQTFDNYWGLPPASFTKIYANGNGDCNVPPADANWALEESLDIEWAHVFASNAAIILVEACSNSYTDLFYAEQVAFNYIVANYPAGGQVSNSWQGPELPAATQIAADPIFADFSYNAATHYQTHILALASSGDAGFGAGYPSTNPWVISAGGTSVWRNASTLKFASESCWGDSGGGPSAVETYATKYTGGNIGPWANYQYPIFGGVESKATRVTPDLSFDADPASGVYVYSGYNGGWYVVGGTSVSSPSLAGIINRSGNKLGSVSLTPITGTNWFAAGEHNLLYSQLTAAKEYKTNFYDITTGSNGSEAMPSYDMCTGVGSPRGLIGK